MGKATNQIKVHEIMQLGRAAVGQHGEHIAQLSYRQLGFNIVAKDFYNPVSKKQGEIDFIASRHNLLVFVEVKTRVTKPDAYRSATEAITRAKQLRILKTIKWFLYTKPKYSQYRMRIDVCLVFLDKTAKYVRILSNAVEELY